MRDITSAGQIAAHAVGDRRRTVAIVSLRALSFSASSDLTDALWRTGTCRKSPCVQTRYTFDLSYCRSLSRTAAWFKNTPTMPPASSHRPYRESYLTEVAPCWRELQKH